MAAAIVAVRNARVNVMTPSNPARKLFDDSRHRLSSGQVQGKGDA
jgi:hypothetical protein